MNKLLISAVVAFSLGGCTPQGEVASPFENPQIPCAIGTLILATMDADPNIQGLTQDICQYLVNKPVPTSSNVTRYMQEVLQDYVPPKGYENDYLRVQAHFGL